MASPTVSRGRVRAACVRCGRASTSSIDRESLVKATAFSSASFSDLSLGVRRDDAERCPSCHPAFMHHARVPSIGLGSEAIVSVSSLACQAGTSTSGDGALAAAAAAAACSRASTRRGRTGERTSRDGSASTSTSTSTSTKWVQVPGKSAGDPSYWWNVDTGETSWDAPALASAPQSCCGAAVPPPVPSRHHLAVSHNLNTTATENSAINVGDPLDDLSVL